MVSEHMINEMKNWRIILAVVVVAIVVSILFLFYSQSNMSHKLLGPLYQPLPPKGISVISGNVTWYYDNATNTIIVFSAMANATSDCPTHSGTEECTIGVIKGQKIKFNQSLTFVLVENGVIRLGNETLEMNMTGNISLLKWVPVGP